MIVSNFDDDHHHHISSPLIQHHQHQQYHYIYIVSFFSKFSDLDEASWEVLLLNAMLAFTLNVLIALTLSLGFFSVFSVCCFFCPTFATLGIFRRYDSNETWYNLGGRLGITCWVLQLQTSRRWIPVTEGSASPLCPLFWWAFARFRGGGRRFFVCFFGVGLGWWMNKPLIRDY